MKIENVYAVIDDVAENVCHVFFANTVGFAQRVFEDFLKRAEIPEDKRKYYKLVQCNSVFSLPETYDEFMENSSEV